MAFKDPEKRRAYHRKYQREWQRKCPEKRAVLARTYRRNRPEHVRYSTLRSTSRQRDTPFLLTRTEFYEWYNSQPNKCHYCDLVDITLDCELSGNRHPLTFTIDRKDSSQPYVLSNMVFACWVCNRLKSNEFSHDEWLEIAQKYVKPKWKKKLELANAA